MSEPAIWEVTRKYWKISRRPDDYFKYVFCVHDAVVQGVWRVTIGTALALFRDARATGSRHN
jgi:hypothetical protein